MVDIDERVVSMKFDSSDFEQKSKSTLSILDKLHEKLSFKNNDADALNSIADNVQKVADKAYTIVDRTIDKIKDNIANNLVNFLQENTFGQFKSGFEKYAEMTTSVATLKGQGYAMDKITEQLKRLNYFTDETSYNFTDMVREIGKFTAAGQSLEDATTAMMGIAEWAALSGKNANEASRAMYQLSQALGAGQMRLVDYKSIQNLNMDTVEFRKNAIQAAIAVGTLKDNLNGTYTSTISNETFNINEFAEKLTKGKWFNTDVMMTVFQQYSEAVDDVKEIYEKGRLIGADGIRYDDLDTTAEAIRAVKKNNEALVAKFAKTKLNSDQISALLKKWKQVENVTGKTVKEYAELKGITEDQAKILMEQKQEGYAEYLKEYGETFKDAEKSAEDALRDWQSYVSEFGVKSFMAAQEAKTFREAIESAKDAASTVWTTIYTTVFGDYEEAKEIWTDLANSLYEIFVDRLWDINDVFEYWKTGGKSALVNDLNDLKDELEQLQEIDLSKKSKSEVKEIKAQMEELKTEINELQTTIDNTDFINGRTRMFQGIYAFGSGLKSMIFNFRDAWDSLIEDNSGGEKLLKLSEKIRYDGFRFYDMMTNEDTGLASTDFYKNVAESIQNILSPLRAAVRIIREVIGQFLPKGDTLVDTLTKISEKVRDFTRHLVPSEKTIQNIARVLRGFVAILKLLFKAGKALYDIVIKPIFTVLYAAFSELFGGILEILANIGDAFYSFEEGVGEMEALAAVGELVQKIFGGIAYAVGTVARVIVAILGPAIMFVVNSIKEIITKARELIANNKGSIFITIAEGIKQMHARAKEAWHSMESLADIFNRFKDGKGLSNVILMLGEMLDNLITRIGKTVLAIFGLEDAIGDSGLANTMSTVKTVFVNAVTLIKWIYTNVLRPMLGTMFIGLAEMIRKLGQSVKEGDINAILTQLREIIKTFTSLQLFKLFRVITKIFGSGGLIRLINNAATALRSFRRWMGAKAMNEFSGTVIKLALAFAILAGAAAALSFLPAENLERVNQIMITFGIALGGVLLILLALTLVAGEAYWGLFGLCGAFMALTALVITLVVAAKLFNDFLNNMIGNTENVGEAISKLAAILLPFISVIGLLITIIGLVKKASGGGVSFIQFGLGFIGIVNSVSAIINALQALLNIMHDPKNTLGDIIIAIGIMLGMFFMLAASTKLVANKLAQGKHAFGEGIASGIAMVISLAGFALIVRMVLIPTLDTLVENRDKFPAYLEAMAVIAACMLGIGGTFSLMAKSRNFASILSTGFMFKLVANTIVNTIVPMLKELDGVGVDVLPGVAMLALTMAALGFGIKLIFNGIADIITAISKINWKNWLAIIIPTGLIIAGVILLCHVFNDVSTEISAGAIIAIIGTVVAIILAFGLFAKMMLQTAGNGLGDEYKLTKVADLFKAMTKFIGVILLGLTGAMVVLKLIYAENVSEAMDLLVAFSMMTLLTLAGTLFFFFASFKSILETLKTNNLTDIYKALDIIKYALLAIGAILLVLAMTPLLLKSYNVKTEDTLSIISNLALASVVIVVGCLSAMGKFVRQLNGTNLSIKENDLKVIGLTFVGLIAIIAEMGLLVVPSLAQIQSVPWETIAATMAGAVGVIATVMAMMQSLLTSSAGLAVNGKSYAAGILGFVIALAAVAAYIYVLATALAKLSSVDPTAMFAALLPIIVPLGMVLLLIESFTKGDVGTKFNAAATNVAMGLTKIALAAVAVAAAIALIMELFNPGSTWLGQIFNGLTGGFKKGAKDLENATEDYIVDPINGTVTKEEDIKSPSGVFEEYGEFIDKGLGLGIKKNSDYVTDMAAGLAEYTNEAFQDALGIHSPSKVFYENGRFVVRGFINGMDDESNKNKKAGSDMAEGFSEGMDKAMENMGEKWKGLWSEMGMDFDIKSAISEGTEGLAGSLFDGFFGEAGEALTEEEEKELEELIAKRDQMIKDGKVATDEYAKLSQRLGELQSKKKASQNFTTGFKGSITDVISQFTKDGTISDMFESFGTTLGGGFMTAFTDENGNFDLGETLNGAFAGIGDFITGDILGSFNSEEFSNKMDDVGSNMGQSIVNGIKRELDASDWLYDKIIKPTLDFWSGEGNQYANEVNFKYWYTRNADEYGLGMDTEKGSHFYYRVLNAIREFGDEGEIDEDYFKQYAEDYLKLGSNWQFADTLKIQDGIFTLWEGFGNWKINEENQTDWSNKHAGADDNIEYYQYLRNALDEYMEGTDEYKDQEISKYGSQIYKELVKRNLIDKETGRLNLNNYIRELNLAAKPREEYYAWLNGDGQDILNDFGNWINTGGYKIAAENEELNEQAKKLLTEAGFAAEDFNETQLNALRDWALKNGYLDFYTRTISDNAINNTDQLSTIISYLQIISGNTTTFEKTTYDQLKASGISLSYLKSLEDAGKKGDAYSYAKLNEITGGKSLDAFLNDIQTSYSNVVHLMMSSDYGKMSSEQKKYYQEMKEYYEKYFLLNEESVQVSNASDLVKQIAEENAKKNEREEQSRNAVSYNEKRNGINDWLNSQGKAKVKDFAGFDELVQKAGLSELDAKELLRFFQMGLDEQWIKIDQDGKVQAAKVSEDIIKTIRQRFGIASPSRVAISLMGYFMDGIRIGIQTGLGAVLNTVTDVTSAMVDTTTEGLESLKTPMAVMLDSLTKDIQPQITPVFDGSVLSTGVSALASSFDNISPRVSATANSFVKDSNNYNSQLDALSSQMAGMNSLINSFMNLVADGEIVTVNVNAEANNDNLYQMVVDTNKQKFRQTGKNPLAY